MDEQPQYISTFENGRLLIHMPHIDTAAELKDVERLFKLIRRQIARRVFAELSQYELNEAVAEYVSRHNALHEKGYAKLMKLDVFRDEDNKPDGCTIEIYY